MVSYLRHGRYLCILSNKFFDILGYFNVTVWLVVFHVLHGYNGRVKTINNGDIKPSRALVSIHGQFVATFGAFSDILLWFLLPLLGLCAVVDNTC